MAYAVRCFICIIIYHERCQSESFPSDLYVNYTAIMHTVLRFCLLDELKAPFRIKISILTLASAYFYLFVYFRNVTCDAPNSCYIGISSRLKANISDFMVRSVRIVSNFAWKLTLYSIFKDHKSALIKKSVQIICI